MSFQCLFDVCAMSNRRWNVVYLQGRGFILCHRQSLGKPSWFAPKFKRSLKFNHLRVHQLSQYSCLALWSLERDITSIDWSITFPSLHKAHEGITFTTPLTNQLWIHHKNCLYPTNLHDLNSDKHKISYSPFVDFVAL